jgi:hypothetical protein
MTIALIIIASVVAVAAILIVTTRLVLYASHRASDSTVSLTIIGCGLLYDPGQSRSGIVCGRFKYFFKSRPKKVIAGKTEKKKAEPDSAFKNWWRKLPLSSRVKICRAALLFAARFLSRLHYDEGGLETRPVFADPALTGMVYGFGQAFYGIFPGARRTVNLVPDFGAKKSKWTGHLTLSIKNRQVIYIGYRLLGDLPIREITKSWFLKRGG